MSENTMTINYGYSDYGLIVSVYDNELWLFNKKEKLQRKYFVDSFLTDGFAANKNNRYWFGDMILRFKDEELIKQWLKGLNLTF